MGIISAFSKSFVGKKKEPENDNIGSYLYQRLACICSNKTNAKSIDNIGDLVDGSVVRDKVSFSEKQVDDAYDVHFLVDKALRKKIPSYTQGKTVSNEKDFVHYKAGSPSKEPIAKSNAVTYSKSKLKKKIRSDSWLVSVKKRFLMSCEMMMEVEKLLGSVKLPMRKFLTVVLSVLLIFVTIASASLLSLPNDSGLDVLSVSLFPRNLPIGDRMFVNVTIPASYHIRSVIANMTSIETINLSLSDNSSTEQLWQGVWMAHDVEVGEYVATVTAINEENTFYYSEIRWSVLPEETLDDNQSSETGTNETKDSTINETFTGENETVVSVGLNLSLQSDKDAYFVNETVSIHGTVSYNNSLINTSVSLLIDDPTYNSSVSLNASDGRFYHQFVPSVVGGYSVQGVVSYENQTVIEEIDFYVQDIPLDNVSQEMVSELYIWDDTDIFRRYVDDTITFYANYSSGNLSIENATCLISFNVENWSLPVVMSYSNGFYVYSRSFNVSGSFEYRVWCSAPGFENRSAIGECFVYEIVTNVTLISDLYIWDDTDYPTRYAGDKVTFYANYSSDNVSIRNATCLISFNVGAWSEPTVMNYSNGLYVYSRSFDIAGTHQFRVWCSAPGFENKSIVDEFVVSEVVKNVSIVDAKEEEFVYALPGASFYVERTVDGLNGTDVVFAPLFSDGLTFEKIEVFEGVKDAGEEMQAMEMTSDGSLTPRVYISGRAVSRIEKRIDSLRENLPSDIQRLNRVAYSQSFRLQHPVTVRMWFKVPSWEEIRSGVKPSSGRISYLVFSDDAFDFEGSTWWNSNWNYRKLITINHSQVDADLTNFPVLVYVASDSDLASHAQDDGDDIAFVLYSDNTTQLNHEIELFNGTSGELVAWVNVTSLSSSVDTNIWMYYGNSGCSTQENPTGVWDSNYTMVQHLNETSDPHEDSTSYNNDGNESGGVDQSATGKADGADDFDGIDDYVNIFDDASLRLTNGGTIEAWIYPRTDGESNYGRIVDKSLNDLGGGSGYEFDVESTNNLGFNIDSQLSDLHTTTGVLTLNAWNYVVATFDGQYWRIYSNGTEVANKSSSVLPPDTAATVRIGNRADATDRTFDGTIDEVRISDTTRNASWINTCYNNMNNPSTFISTGSEEQSPAPTIDLVNPALNGTTGVSLQPSCQIWANDTNGDTLTVYWYENTTGSWVLRNTNNSVSANSTVSYTFTEFSNYSTTYWWKVAVNDSIDNTSAVYYFTTEPIGTSVDPISPYGVTSSPLNITATGNSDLDNVTLYYRWSDDNISWTPGNTTIIFESFESSVPPSGWAQEYVVGIVDWARVNPSSNPSSAKHGTYIAELEDDDVGDDKTMLITPSIDLTNYDSAWLDFQHYMEDWLGDQDELRVYWKNTTGGDSWHILAEYTSNVDSWTRRVLQPPYMNEINIAFEGNAKWGYGVCIDCVYINGSCNGQGINWTGWNNNSNPDAGYPWSWDFNFPNSTGYYEFYSIGKKAGTPDETVPSNADARCHYTFISISVTPSQWNQGTVDIGSSNATTGYNFNLTNEGDVTLNIQINASNATNSTTGARWNLTSSAGYNNFSLQYNKSSTWTNINTTYDTFVTSLGVGGYQTFDLKLIMATASLKKDPLSFTITFKSVVS